MAGYYFVTFGRERGGYLDLLGLAPDASTQEQRRKETEYTKALEQECRQAIQTARTKQKAGEITGEEVNAEIQKANNAKNDKGMKLRELKQAFESIAIQRRGLENSGHVMQADGWRPVYQSLDITRVWNDLFRQPLDQIDMEQVGNLRAQWLAILKGEAAPSRASSATPASVLAWIRERCLFHVTAADMLWQELEFTNRDYWEREIGAWSQEAEKLGLALNGQARGSTLQEWDYPDLCCMGPSMIDHLNAGDTVISAGPETQQSDPPVEEDFEEIIKAFLERSDQ